MSPWLLLLILWLASVVMMWLGWRWQRRHDNAGIVDVLWAAGLGAGALLLALWGGGAPAPRTAVALLGGTWACRLAAHLWRRVGHQAEDGRYRHLREHWRGEQWRFLLFFESQAFLVVLFALPFLAAASNPVTSWGWLMLGAVIGCLSVLGESLADRQLARFRADPANRGRICSTGLWRYSRHPNYFFEWLHWFAYIAFAMGSPLAWLAWTGPVWMFLFLRWISGIPFTEAQALRQRGEDYRVYQHSTSMLFPWPPRKIGASAARKRYRR